MALATSGNDITHLIAGFQLDNPRLYQALMELEGRLSGVEVELQPLVRQSTISAVAEAVLTPPSNFTYTFTNRTVRLTWSVVAGAAQYEIRKGTDWDTATFQLRTSTAPVVTVGGDLVQQADIDPLLSGSHSFLIKSIGNSGAYSTTATQVVVVVPTILAPTVTAQVLDNNVLLTWTTPAAVFEITHYIVRRGESQVGIITGNFSVWFEVIGGTYTYSVAAVDIAGNESAAGPVNVTLNTPADFVLQATRQSTLGAYVYDPTHFVYLSEVSLIGDVNYRYKAQAGFESDPTHFYFAESVITSTLSNVIRMDGPKLLACWASETFRNHFVSRAWSTPKNQVDAGYPIYIQPANLTGYFEEIYDYGGLFNNNIVTVSWAQNLLTTNQVTVVVKMAVSTDGIAYGAYTTGASQFFQSLRFLKLKLEFTCENDKALLELFNLTISLSVKKELDSGVVTANSGDVGGTQVNFNKAFKDIDSITLAVGSKEPVTAIYDFVDIPNPVGFKVFALDSSGNRITYPVSWKARGIV